MCLAMNLQRALSSQSCSTSAPTSVPTRAHHTIWCNAASSDASRPDSKHRQHFSKGYSTGCYVQRPPPQTASSGNGAGPAVMQGLGTPLPNQQSNSISALASEPYDVTEFVAETLLPTQTGKYRLRGYRHTVFPACKLSSFVFRLCLLVKVGSPMSITSRQHVGSC